MRKPADQMTVEEIREELFELDRSWKEIHEDDEGSAGSPGEWIFERTNELEQELEGRSLLNQEKDEQ